MTAAKSVFNIWVVEGTGASGGALRASLERAEETSVRVLAEDELAKPLRFATAPDLVILCCEWRPRLESALKNVTTAPLWLDLVHQNDESVAGFHAFCLARGLEGSALELSPMQLDWTLALVDLYRAKSGSLVYAARTGDSSLQSAAIAGPGTLYCSRLVRPYEIGARIDYLASRTRGAPALHWYTVLASLSQLALEAADDLRTAAATPGTPAASSVLQLCAGEVGSSSWIVALQIAVSKRQGLRLQQLLNRFRQDSAIREGLSFRILTRECGGLVVTHSETCLELAVVFNPQAPFGARLADPEAGFREALVFRKVGGAPFNPATAQYVHFPDRRPGRDDGPESRPSSEGGPGELKATLAQKAEQQLTQIFRVGSDESFVAYLKGIDVTSGDSHSRFSRLLDTVDKGGTVQERELLRDLMKRYFALVEEGKARKLPRAG